MKYKKIGEIQTSSDSMLIGDPAHFIHVGYDSPSILGEDWDDFIKNIEEITEDGVSKLPYDDGMPGLGIILPSNKKITIWGKYDDDKLSEIRIVL